MRRKRILAAAVIAIVVLAIPWICLRVSAIPFRGVVPGESSPLWQRSGYLKVEPDRKIFCMIRRAKLDFLVAPIEGLRGNIVFEEVRQNGNDIYLLFGASSSDAVVVYHGTKDTCRLDWKILLALDA
jgi:hypothetical protein